MAIAACASPLVGYLAEHVFGFHGAASAGAAGAGGVPDPGEDLGKARALGDALVVCMVVPWSICLVVYTGQSQLIASMAVGFSYSSRTRAVALRVCLIVA